MTLEPYPIFEVQPEWVLEPEVLGSKEKFWYRRIQSEKEWLFKYPQPDTGQHWAEKIAEQIALVLGISHGKVELAVFQGTHGSATESFVSGGANLFHGNQILAGKVFGYNPRKEFHQSDHTLANIFTALENTFAEEAGQEKAKKMLARYFILDAVIGNTDRHHENWAILAVREPDKWGGRVAPSFDHASSLGRELKDEGPKKSRVRLLAEGKVGSYSEKARGAIFGKNTDEHGLSPLGLVRKGVEDYPLYFKPALVIAKRLSREKIVEIVDRIPNDWMTEITRKFVVNFVCYNLSKLEELANE